MDLVSEVRRLTLDVLAVDVSGCLGRAGVPHALLKGPSTALWLYDPPREYADVDVLVPLSRVSEVRAVLESAGLAYARAGGVGEEAQHSLLMISPAGCEVDVHISLPAIPPDGDRVWEVIAPHVANLDLGIGTVPALDEPARCLMLALHALGGGSYGRPAEDLRRALAVTTCDQWREAQQLARAVSAEDLFLAGLSAGDTGSPRLALSRRAYLYVTAAPSEALGLQRLQEARRRDLPRLLCREIFPTLGFMRYAYPYARGPVALARVYVARWRRIGAHLPSAIRVWRRAGAAQRGVVQYQGQLSAGPPLSTSSSCGVRSPSEQLARLLPTPSRSRTIGPRPTTSVQSPPRRSTRRSRRRCRG